MRARAASLFRVQPEALRGALLNPVGLTLLLLSALPVAAATALSVTAMPNLAPLAARIIWLLPLGLLAYLATVLTCLLLPPAWPDDSGMRQLLVIQRSMQERLHELRSDREHAGRAVPLPAIAESVGRTSRQLVPTFGQIVIVRDKLNRQLVRYDKGELRLPNPAILGKLRQRNLGRQAELDACLQQAANTYATLLAPLDEADGVGLRPQAEMWARDLEDIYDALVDVRSGLDYYDRALLGPGPDAGASATILTRLDLEAGLTDGAGAAPVEVRAPTRRVGRVPSKVYPAGLSAREVEVLRLIARGKTSKEIAAGLIVTVATVSRHIANIYTKIDARGRADATRYA